MSYYTMNDTENDKSSGSGLWIILIIVAIVVILIIVGLGIWLFGDVEEDRLLIANGVTFSVPSDGTIEATWTSTNNSDDVLVLYVISNPDQMTFDASGVPQGSYLNSGTPSPSTAGSIPSTTPSSAGSASVTGLKAGIYTATLVVTNPNISDKSYQQTSKALPVKVGALPVIFTITAAGETGAIRYDPSSKPTRVGYQTGKIVKDSVGFHQDSDGRICAASTGSWSADSMCDVGSHILYADVANELSINARPVDASGVVSPVTPDNSEWIYINGKWCLKSDRTRCMSLNTSPNVSPTTITLTTPSGTISDTLEKVTLSTSADVNKWTNQAITP
jgi:hypothetical protein